MLDSDDRLSVELGEMRSTPRQSGGLEQKVKLVPQSVHLVYWKDIFFLASNVANHGPHVYFALKSGFASCVFFFFFLVEEVQYMT